ncbi:Heat shock transcription factor [Coemansia sp. RSA 451]|nr:Heat shock transcription factor [Coemansia sp. RSA 451]
MSGIVSRRGNNVHRNITVTPFLNKLYSMVDDRASDDLIRWTSDGNSFVVLRHEDFAKEVLPRFFKHSNFSSFVRQLNMYGFHKVPHLQQGGLMADGPGAESWEFNNENFQRGQPDLLHFIRRKKGSRDSGAGTEGTDAAAADDEELESADEGDVADVGAEGVSRARASSAAARGVEANGAKARGAETGGAKARASRTPPVNLAKILKEIQVIRDHQLTISSDIKRLQDENQSMWMQASATEERYNKHQQTIDKILRFLATVFSADARYAEVQPPLRRLISHNAKNAAKGAADTGNAARSSWTQNVFEDMDFPDLLSATERPPGKKQRTGKTEPPSAIYELPSNSPSPAEPAGPSPQRGVYSNSLGQTSGRTVRRKTSSPQQSTALTRAQPRPRFGAQLPSSAQFLSAVADIKDESSALLASPGNPYTNRLKKNTKSIEQLQQEVDNLGHSLESLTRQLQTGMLPQTVYPAAPTVAPPQPPGVIGSIGSAAYGPPMPTKDDYSAMLTSEALESFAASLVDPGLSVSGHSAPSTDRMGVTDPNMAPYLGMADNSLQSVLTTDPADSAAQYGSADAFNSNAMLDMLRSCTPEQYDNLQNYFRLINNPVNTHLLTDARSAESPPAATDTPFLDFVDPDADVAQSAGANDATQTNDYTQILLNALNNSTSGQVPLGSADAEFSGDLAASFLHAVSSAVGADGLTATDGVSVETNQQNNA